MGELAGRLLNAPPGTVCMHTNVSQVQALVASCYDFDGPRRRVVCTDQNFPTNLYVWRGVPGAELVVVPSEDDGSVPTERLLEAIDERTAVVPVSHVLFKSAFVQDAAAIAARARQVGAHLVLDTYQSLGCLPVDVRAWDVDMAVGGSVKWLCGGPGAAYLYVRPELHEVLRPRATGWAAHAAPFDFESGPQRHAAGVRRFLTGTPAVPSLVAARVGYEIVLEVGVTAIRAWSRHLVQRLAQELEARGFALFGPTDPEQRAGTLSVALEDHEDGAAWVRALDQLGFVVDHRPGAGLRVSPHFYSLPEEVDALAEALSGLREGGAWRRYA